MMRFFKYHALGNDYIALDPCDWEGGLSPSQVQQICHRHYGVGSDGILLGPMESTEGDYGLRIYNSDGSEAEKSGNGLRIFSRYLWDKGLIQGRPITLMTAGGRVTSRIIDQGRRVHVEMGQVSFDSERIPVQGPRRDVINESVVVGDREFLFCAATIGNPHCVVLMDQVSEEEARAFGPPIEKDPRFPNRTNVQFLKVLNRSDIRVEIWERGAGYTLASGSGGCAAAAVAYKLGLCDSEITVHMPGGELEVFVSEDLFVSMTGPVTKVAEGRISEEIFERPQKAIRPSGRGDVAAPQSPRR